MLPAVPSTPEERERPGLHPQDADPGAGSTADVEMGRRT
jgi:hypothetical protein